MKNTWLVTSFIVLMTSSLLLMTFFEQQDESFFTNGVKTLQHQYKKRVDYKGGYIEKNEPHFLTFHEGILASF